MRQIICNRGGAIVARAPRPLTGRGRVLVRVEYSLVSVGTELAPLRALVDPEQSSLEQASAYGALARRYLGAALRDPGRAWRRAGEIASHELRRRWPRRPLADLRPESRLDELTWQREAAARCDFTEQGLLVETDGSPGAYQVRTAELEIAEDRLPVAHIRGCVESGRVAIGWLDVAGDRWLGSRVLDGDFDEHLCWEAGSARKVALVVAGGGDASLARLVLECADLGSWSRDEFERSRSDLDDQGWEVGYSAAGVVVEIGSGIDDLAVGDRVACAGAAHAHHAEYVSVPRNLVARVPRACDPRAAATTTIGCVALQALRRSRPQLGETVCVVGLGLIGQLTTRLLLANGCRVIGCDLDPARVERARGAGLLLGSSDSEELRRQVRDATGGHGVDCTIITAASRSDAPVNLAMEITRVRGRVVLVGDVGLDVRRESFYRKEIDLLMSMSYGPGRYDAEYEEEGRDYPFGHVRWTLNRNMQAYLGLLADARVKVESLFDRDVELGDAPDAYRELADGGPGAPLGVLIRYPAELAELESGDATRIELRGHRSAREGPARYALVGAGAFGTSLLVPELARLPDQFFLRGVVSRSMTAATGNFARNQRLEVLTTDLDAVLRDPDFDLVVIATRHDGHADSVVRSLQAGKHVFVEKPLALSWEQLDRVAEVLRKLPEPRLLMVGFNRRFSPALRQLAELLSDRRSPLVMQYRVNAGYLPLDHWVHGPQGGGRNLGEACHIYDVFRFLARSGPASVSATPIDPGELPYRRSDNFSATLRYEDGSVGNLVYTALGPSEGLPKERLEIFCDGEAYVLDDYRSLTRARDGETLWRGSQDKGHSEELRQLGSCLADGRAAPVSADEIFEVTATALHVEDLLRGLGSQGDD